MKKILKLGMIGIMSAFYLLAVYYSGLAGKGAGTVTVLLDGQPLNEKAASEICTREGEQEISLSACFWKEQKDMEFSCKETGSSSIGTMTVTEGNPDLVVPGTSSLVWQENGCFIDTKMAEELFGTEQASGQTIWCSGKSYVVCGTFESITKSMIRQINGEDKEILNTLSLYSPNSGTAKNDGEQFLMRYGLSGDVIEFQFLNALVSDLLLVLPAMLLIALAWMVLRGGVQQNCEKHPSKAEESGEGKMQLGKAGVDIRTVAGQVILLAALTGALAWLLWSKLVIPSDMIPTKWSDFSFWTSWWKGQRQNLLCILGTAQGEAQLSMIWNLILAFICNLCAVFSGILVL
ncbi:MAG: hypothetical protein PHR92_15100 [Lachnospiraceae bacterium]|nr:hypothetical protein [Lachnospiraceae bacterium]